MTPSSRLTTSRPWVAHVLTRAMPLVASGLAHVLLVGAVLAVDLRATPRLEPAAETELVVLARDVVPTEPPPPPVEARRPVRTPPVPAVAPPAPPPRVSPPPPPKPVEVPAARPVIPPRAEETPPAQPQPPPKVEEVRPAPPLRGEEKVEIAPAPKPKPDGDGGSEGGGPRAEPGRSAGSAFGAPMPSGEARAGSGRSGAAPSGAGSSPTTAGGGGTGVAALPGTGGSPRGTGITRSALPRGGYQVQPVYPTSARQLGIQGTSLLRVHVAADGHVADVVVSKSAGHPDMDQAAAAAVRQWRFEPARRGEEPVAMWVVLPVEFRIR